MQENQNQNRLTYVRTSKHSGADWVRGVSAKPVSTLGAEVADLLGDVYRGIYHLEDATSVDWSDQQCIEVHPHGVLSTFDFDNLTQLVVLAHDRLIRVEVRAHEVLVDEEGHVRDRAPANGTWANEPGNTYACPTLCLMFHKRKGREGRFSERHPTLEEAAMVVRRAFGGPTPEDLAAAANRMRGIHA